MLKSNDIYWVHEQLFAAAANEVPFTEVLQTIVDAFDGAGGVIFELNRKTGAVTNWIGSGLEDGEDDYISHLNAINPRMHYSLRHAAGHVAYESKFINDTNMDRHEFYDAIERSVGVRYFLGSRIFDDRDISLFHSIEFTNRHGHPDDERIDSFRRFAPAIGNAWRLASRSQFSADHSTLSPWTPDHLPWSIFALSSNGTILEMNNSACETLNRSDVVKLHDGVLISANPVSAAKFENALHQGIAGEASQLLLNSKDGSTPIIVQILPVNPAKIPAPQSISILVYIWNPLQDIRVFDDVLADLYGLTQAETRLVSMLAIGISLNLAAKQLGISRNTAGNQLQSIFAKTGTHRQSELLVQITGILEI